MQSYIPEYDSKSIKSFGFSENMCECITDDVGERQVDSTESCTICARCSWRGLRLAVPQWASEIGRGTYDATNENRGATVLRTFENNK